MEFLGESPVAPMHGITNHSWYSNPDAATEMVASPPPREISPTFLSSAGSAKKQII